MKTLRWWWALGGIVVFAFAAMRLQHEPRGLVAAGVVAYEHGDFAASVRFFEQAGEQAGEHRFAQRNLALAVLAADDLERAAEVVNQLARSGRAVDLQWRDFLLGNISWRRSEIAEVEAHGPIPPAGALERSIAHAIAAQTAWQVALEARGLWPEAERNLARVEHRIATLRAEQQALAASQMDNAENAAATPELAPASLDPDEQEQLLQQLERLDLQREERKVQEPLQQGGFEW